MSVPVNDHDAAPLVSHYRGLICDLDGVVYLGHLAVGHAVSSLNQARAGGVGVSFATNNASRPPAQVAAQLRSLGLTAADGDVVTSSQAGAALLADRIGRGVPVLAVGGPGVTWALEHEGMGVIRARQTGPRAPVRGVLQGLGKDVDWVDLAEAALAIQGGATWVATNRDATVPTDRGQCPGNGALVDAVAHAVSTAPMVAGKPEAPLYLLCASILGVEAKQTLAIGDRLDTDVVGASRAGMDSLHVGTGVNTWIDVAHADGERRPTHVASDLRALHRPIPQVLVETDGELVRARCGGAQVELPRGGGLAVSPVGTSVDDPTAAAEHRLRALIWALWAGRDTGRCNLGEDDWARADGWYRQGRQDDP